MNNRPLTIEVYSDVVCPWCYVGKRRLERALAQRQGSVKGEIIWRPFQLNPTMPAEGVERTAYLEAKFGSMEAFRRLEEHVTDAAREERIAFAFERIARTPNTFLAHRLIWYAALRDRQDEVVESLFKGYFQEGEEIGSQASLVRLGRHAGLDGADVERFFRTDEGTVEVKEEEAAGGRLGIRSVPYFVVNRAYGISGAQPVERFVAAIDTIQAQPVTAGDHAPDER
ncbi:putative thiol oxidoreductase, DsbA family, FrnE subfamily [Nitrospira japonica]|uniref:Putative thiol oxidoreductase, DsbA family, FrnE subfamily n=1 Tax=Nitrospira japonica TaxID=1325564 RepID=A0A1W1I2E7_9BACT|nr:DsbA family oxidoreductase [Nitrospira japonica]SLM47186.1 putative thiol oxidoreductase, DsbA family, FrnE subfamily [Nitrospira japonica]